MISSFAPRSVRPLFAASSRGRLQVRPMASASFREAMPKEARELLDGPGYRYLDVRTKDEFAGGRAPSAVNVPVVNFGAGGMVPNAAFLEEVKKAFPDKAEPIIVGCKSGRRSLMAIDIMTQAGYTDLTNLTGGFDLWAGQGMPVEA